MSNIPLLLTDPSELFLCLVLACRSRVLAPAISYRPTDFSLCESSL